MLYKITTGQACVRCPDLKIQRASGRRISRHSLQYQRFSCRTDYRSNTFPTTVKDWNELALDAVLSPILCTFKSKVSPPPNKFEHFFFLPVTLLPIKAALYPKMTGMASFVADGH